MPFPIVPQRCGPAPHARWALAALLMLCLLLASRAAWAADPVPLTKITNQATATFKDPTGALQTVNSNEVYAIVQQVGSFTLDGNSQSVTTVINTKTGAPGTTVTAPHTLMNTGNDEDRFTVTVKEEKSGRISKIEVYLDPEGKGTATGDALCSAKASKECKVTPQSVAAGAKLNFVVVYTIPEQAPPDTPYAKAVITAAPDDDKLYVGANKSVADFDQINVPGTASFSVKKKIGAPEVAPAGGTWPATGNKGPRSTLSSCEIVWSSTLVSSKDCQYLTYTLTITNTGSSAGRFALSDELPTEVTYVRGSTIWSGAPGKALGDDGASNPNGIEFQVLQGNRLNAVVASIPKGKSRTLSFVVLVNPATATKQPKSFANTAQFTQIPADPKDVPTLITTPLTPTEPATYTVDTPSLVKVDLTNTAEGKGNGKIGEGDLGPGPSPNPTTTVKAAPGESAVFKLFVKNEGSAESSFKLSASQSSGGTGALPQGWKVKFVPATEACAAQEITSTDVIKAGGQHQVNACVTPSAEAKVGNTVLIYFRVESTTAPKGGKPAIDVKTDAVTVVEKKTLVIKELTLTPEGKDKVVPGKFVDYPHLLTNLGSQSCGAYTLKVSLPPADVAAGWTTQIYLDVDGDGKIGGSDTLVEGPIKQALLSKASQKLLVRVYAPAGAGGGGDHRAELTATFEPVDGKTCQPVSVTDTSTLAIGAISLIKTQALDARCTGKADDANFTKKPLKVGPGQCIVYRIVATNESKGQLADLSVSDKVPSQTSLNLLQPGDPCKATGVGGQVYGNAIGQDPACGLGSNQVDPKGTITLEFTVKVNGK